MSFSVALRVKYHPTKDVENITQKHRRPGMAAGATKEEKEERAMGSQSPRDFLDTFSDVKNETIAESARPGNVLTREPPELFGNPLAVVHAGIPHPPQTRDHQSDDPHPVG